MISEKLIQDKMDSIDDVLTYREEIFFIAGLNFAEEYYQKEIESILQKMNEYKEKLAEIKSGVYHGQN